MLRNVHLDITLIIERDNALITVMDCSQIMVKFLKHAHHYANQIHMPIRLIINVKTDAQLIITQSKLEENVFSFARTVGSLINLQTNVYKNALLSIHMLIV